MIALALALAGCSLGAAPLDSGACGRSPPLDYPSFGAGIMTVHCTGCHSSYLPESQRLGAPLGVDLDTYQGVLDFAERIYVRTIEEETMPPGGGLSSTDLELIDEWLVCGVYADLDQLAAGR